MTFNHKIKQTYLFAHLIIVMVILNLWGCKSGENYVQPNLNLPDAFKALPTSQTQTFSLSLQHSLKKEMTVTPKIPPPGKAPSIMKVKTHPNNGM